MDSFKSYIFKNFEKILVIVVIIAIVMINYLSSYKIGFLNFFYLPVLSAGYFLGRRLGVLSAVLCVSLVILYMMLVPSAFFIEEVENIYVIVSILAWASFLILTSAAVGYLYEKNQKHMEELKAAYIGILEILSKYLESADEYTQGHSIRVAHLSSDISKLMGLSAIERENIRTAALLHDIGKADISMDIVKKAANLTDDEREIIDGHPEKGARILSMVGSVLQDAIPIVLEHHKYYLESEEEARKSGKEIPIGVSIVAVADAFDAMVTDRPYRAGLPIWKAYEELKKGKGKQFHPKVVQTLKKVLLTTDRYN